MEEEEEYVKPTDIAKLLKVSRFTIYKWIREGRMQGVRFGDEVLRVPRSSFDAFMQQAKEKSAAKEEDPGNQKPTRITA